MELQALRPELVQGLQQARAWFRRMVDPATQRLCYKYDPVRRQYAREPSPVRDLGTVADLGVLQGYLQIQEFSQVMQRTQEHYQGALMRRIAGEGEKGKALGWCYLDPARIGEPSSIAHSSMFILALAGHEAHPRPEERRSLMAQLADGILRQQRPDGSYKVYFSPESMADFGWELYAGEAMLALLAAFQRLGQERYLASVERAMPRYEHMYRSGAVGHDEYVFFANWQSQAGRLLVQHTADSGSAAAVASYLFHLHDTIIDKLRLYEAAQKDPERMATVEVGCGVEGLVDAYALALQQEGPGAAERRRRYAEAIRAGVHFLQAVQAKAAEVGGEAAAGGFGHGLTHHLQRIDVTGHVCCAYIKLLGVLEDREL